MATSEAQKRATNKYQKAKLESIQFRVHKGTRDRIAEYAARRDESLAGYIKRLISEDMGEEIR